MGYKRTGMAVLVACYSIPTAAKGSDLAGVVDQWP